MPQAVAPVPFLKMHGLGNDFVVLDLRKGGEVPPQSALAALADRRRGVGCDQVVLLLPPRSPGADAFVRNFNAPHATEIEACGNATRCAARLIAEERRRPEVLLESVAGLLPCTLEADGRVTADMGPARVEALTLPLPGGPAAVNVGNPHCVLFVDDLEATDVGRLGPRYERDPAFPKRANVSFVQVTGPATIRLRVWERDTGLTPACGSAACATVAAAAARGLVARRVRVTLDGGDLDIHWREADDHALMTGPAAYVFYGAYNPR